MVFASIGTKKDEERNRWDWGHINFPCTVRFNHFIHQRKEEEDPAVDSKFLSFSLIQGGAEYSALILHDDLDWSQFRCQY